MSLIKTIVIFCSNYEDAVHLVASVPGLPRSRIISKRMRYPDSGVYVYICTCIRTGATIRVLHALRYIRERGRPGTKAMHLAHIKN